MGTDNYAKEGNQGPLGCILEEKTNQIRMQKAALWAKWNVSSSSSEGAHQ